MKYLDIYLPKVAEKLSCQINFSNPELGVILTHMLATKSELGNFYCPCSVVVEGYPKKLCPCKDWVQMIKMGIAKKHDKCHCELFEKV